MEPLSRHFLQSRLKLSVDDSDGDVNTGRSAVQQQQKIKHSDEEETVTRGGRPLPLLYGLVFGGEKDDDADVVVEQRRE